MHPPIPLVTEPPSAGGAPFDQILVMLAFTTVVYGAVAWIALRERGGHPTLAGRLATAVARADGGPRWFALPAIVVIGGALSGAVGLYWDVSFHLAFGRDEGPLANPAHYLIYLGLVAIFAGAVLGVALARRGELPRNTLRITHAWRTPYGPVVGMAFGMIALLGFPLDDAWHRLFGQDVTEWGPTHVVMIGGTIMIPYSILLSCAEVRQVATSRVRPFLEYVALIVIPTGPVAFLLEFAYGIPQFPLVNDPLILSLTAALAFTLAALRSWWMPLAVWAGYFAIQGGLLGLNVYAFDALPPYPPLLLGGALAATVLARFARPTWRFGLLAGVAITVAQLGVEFFWTEATRPTPWPVEMMPWALLGGVVVGAAAGLLAVWAHVTLLRVAGDPAVPQEATPSFDGRVALTAFAAVLGVMALAVPPAAEGGGELEADLAIVDRTGGEGVVELTLADPEVAEDAWWFEVLAWQGGGAVREPLEEVAPGVYRTDDPVPLTGDWKTLVRLHRPVTTLLALPVYLPEDAAIPVPETPAADETRAFVEEKEILRREEKPDVPGWLWATAYVLVGGLFLSLFAVLGTLWTLAARRPAPRHTDDREQIGVNA